MAKNQSAAKKALPKVPAATTKRRRSADDDESAGSTAEANDTLAGGADTIAGGADTVTGGATGEAATEAVMQAADEVTADDSVFVSVPKAFQLRLTHEKVLSIPSGARSMPRAHAEHWYSQANGVTILEK